MIGKLALKTAESFIKRPNTCYDKIEIYQYGFFVLYSNILFLLLTMLLGAVFGVFLQGIIFYVVFFSIRQYAGGYHASTETRCEVMSTLSILVCLVVTKLSKTYDFQFTLLVVSAVSALCIAVLCPLDTPEKPLSEKEFIFSQNLLFDFVGDIYCCNYFIFCAVEMVANFLCTLLLKPYLRKSFAHSRKDKEIDVE